VSDSRGNLWKDMARRLNLRRLVTFGVIGVVNTGVYFGLYSLLHIFVEYLPAHIVAFVLSMIGSYFLNCWLTFRVSPGWRTFALFPLSNLANFVITTVGLQITVTWLAWNSQWAPLAVALIAVPVTYVVAHYVILGRRRSADTSATVEQEATDSPAL